MLLIGSYRPATSVLLMNQPKSFAILGVIAASLLGGCSLPSGEDGSTAVPRSQSPSVQSAPSPTRELPSSGRLSLEQCVRFGIEKHFGLRSATQDVRFAQADIERARAEFDPQLFGSARRDTVNGRDWSGVNASGGVTKRFATGTEIEVEGGRVPSRTGDFRSDYLGGTSDYSISVRQQLLRGADPKSNRTRIRLAEVVRDAAQATRAAEILEVLRTAEFGYYAAAVAGQVRKAYGESVLRGESVLADVTLRRAAGAASKLDALEAEVLLAAARERYLAASKNYMDRVDELWLTLGAPHRGQTTAIYFGAVTERTIPAGAPDATAEIQRSLALSSTATLLVNEVQRREIELRKARNTALPQLEVEFAAASRSSGGSSGANGWEGIAIARATLPWTFRAERAQLEQAKASLDRSAVAREEAEQRLRVRVAELCRAISIGHQQLALAKKSHSASRMKWQEQVQRHREGVISVRELRESEEDLRTSEIRVLEVLLAQIGAWTSLGQFNGSIASRHNLQF
jgi:outer membrane protein TolC